MADPFDFLSKEDRDRLRTMWEMYRAVSKHAPGLIDDDLMFLLRIVSTLLGKLKISNANP